MESNPVFAMFLGSVLLLGLLLSPVIGQLIMDTTQSIAAIGADEETGEIHSFPMFRFDKIDKISPGCYTIDAETTTADSYLLVAVSDFSVNKTATDRFGNVKETWTTEAISSSPEDRTFFSYYYPMATKICHSDNDSTCHVTIDLATNFDADKIDDLNLMIRCVGDCRVNVSKCSETSENYRRDL